MVLMIKMIKTKYVLGFCCALLLAQPIFANLIPAIDVFLLPGQNAENIEDMNVNACEIVDLRQAQQAMQNDIQKQGLTKEVMVSQIKTSSQAMSEKVQCVSYAHALGVKNFPAIVFDEKYVVYGMTNIQAALQIYQDKVQEPIL